MHELDPDLRRLIESARAAETPTLDSRARVAAAIAAKTGVSVLSVAGAAALATKAAAHTATAAQAATTVGGAVAAPAATAGLALTGKIVAALVVAAGAGIVSVPQARHAVLAVVRGTTHTAPAPERSERLAPATSLAEEAALLEQAQRAFRDGRAEMALPLLDQHDQRFPSGALRPESLAARVMVLCRLERRRDAKVAAAAFLREAPASPLAPQVRASCAGD